MKSVNIPLTNYISTITMAVVESKRVNLYWSRFSRLILWLTCWSFLMMTGLRWKRHDRLEVILARCRLLTVAVQGLGH